MWRYIVGLLATLGAFALMSLVGIVALVTSGPFAGKSLPRQVVLMADLRSVPSESVSSDLLSGGLFSNKRDLTQVLETLWQAADDPRVVGLFVDIGDEQAGLARVQELRQGLARVRGAGKFVIGFAESFGGTASHVADYYLATALEQVWLQPSGSFAITGLAVETPFVRGSLDKLGVRIEGGKRHEYKSMPDSFTRTGFSGPARDNLQQLVDGLYRQFLFDAARDRRMEADRLRALIDTAPLTADQTLREGLVDKLGYRDEALDEMWRRAGTGAQAVTL